MDVTKNRGRERGRPRKVQDVSDIPTFAGGRLSRTALLAGASLFAFAALGASGAARAGCTPSTQTISTAVAGPVLANGGDIGVRAAGSIAGGPIGVFAQNCGINNLTNSGTIGAANGAAPGAAGGIGVRANAGETINLLNNATGATISGGGGASGPVGAGGAGVSNGGTITTLSNGGAISGGGGGLGSASVAAGGAGVLNVGTITTLTNSGKIDGGRGGQVIDGNGGAGGAGVSNGGTITTLSNGGAISGGNGGNGGTASPCCFGGNGGVGVANSGAITRLTNSGAISGGNGGSGSSGAADGGAGVSNAGTITTLSNSGKIEGGAVNGRSSPGGYTGKRTGGAGVSNSATIITLTKSGAISGGAAPGSFSNKENGGAGVTNAGKITTVTNSGAINGGAATAAWFPTVVGGAGVSNSGTIHKLTNSGSISGGTASVAPTAIASLVLAPGGGGAGVSTSGTINKLTNSGMISGGAVSSTTPSRMVGKVVGGAGVSNSGTIAKLINSGMISGGAASAPHGKVTPGDAIYSAGSGASIGTIANSGSITGNVVIDNQSSVTITGGGGSTFGSLTGGTITIGNGNLTFDGGKTFLADSVEVNGGTGIVTNMDPLKVATPQTIVGNFNQVATGALDLNFAGDGRRQYGALAISGSASLNGGLGIELTNGFTLAADDSFDILKFSSLTGNFASLALDGVACSMAAAYSWSCGGGVDLDEVIHPKSLDLVVAEAALGPAGSAAPEPSTWALMLTGLAELAFAGYRRTGKTERRPASPLAPLGGEGRGEGRGRFSARFELAPRSS